MKSNDILYIPDSKGLKVLARGAEAAISVGTSRRHLSVSVLSVRRRFADSVNEGVNGRTIQNRSKRSRPETRRSTDGHSCSVGPALGPGAARTAPARLPDHPAQAPVADSYLPADGRNRGHHCFLQDEAGVRSGSARGSGQRSAIHAAFPGLELLRRIRRHRNLHRNTNQDPAERDPGSDDHQIDGPRSLP